MADPATATKFAGRESRNLDAGEGPDQEGPYQKETEHYHSLLMLQPCLRFRDSSKMFRARL